MIQPGGFAVWEETQQKAWGEGDLRQPGASTSLVPWPSSAKVPCHLEPCPCPQPRSGAAYLLCWVTRAHDRVWHREGSGFAGGSVLPCVGHAVAAGRPWEVCGAPGHEGLWHKVPYVSLASWEKRRNGSKQWEKGKCKGEKMVLRSATLCCAVQCRAVQRCGVLCMPNHTKLSCARLCCAEPGCAVMGCAMKCRAVLRRVEPGCA